MISKAQEKMIQKLMQESKYFKSLTEANAYLKKQIKNDFFYIEMINEAYKNTEGEDESPFRQRPSKMLVDMNKGKQALICPYEKISHFDYYKPKPGEKVFRIQLCDESTKYEPENHIFVIMKSGDTISYPVYDNASIGFEEEIGSPNPPFRHQNILKSLRLESVDKRSTFVNNLRDNSKIFFDIKKINEEIEKNNKLSQALSEKYELDRSPGNDEDVKDYAAEMSSIWNQGKPYAALIWPWELEVFKEHQFKDQEYYYVAFNNTDTNFQVKSFIVSLEKNGNLSVLKPSIQKTSPTENLDEPSDSAKILVPVTKEEYELVCKSIKHVNEPKSLVEISLFALRENPPSIEEFKSLTEMDQKLLEDNDVVPQEIDDDQDSKPKI